MSYLNVALICTSTVQFVLSHKWYLKGVKPRNFNSCQTKYVPGKKKKTCHRNYKNGKQNGTEAKNILHGGKRLKIFGRMSGKWFFMKYVLMQHKC